MELAFRGCSNLQGLATDIPNLSNVTNMAGMFQSATSFINLTGEHRYFIKQHI
jgi:hypothetical protein